MSLSVVLAGHNVDKAALDSVLVGKATGDPDSLSPETLCAAYARISRDPRRIDEIRKDARTEVERARKSNHAIIFDMGHSSVAEHAVFNLDITGVSRLVVELLEHHRLASYTEKSQRYIRLEGEYVVPREIQSAGLEDPFRKHVEGLAQFYQVLANRLTVQAENEFKDRKKKEQASRANEDARYILPLCAEAQVGMTANARTLELMIARLASHSLAEARELGELLYKAVSGVAPSVIRYVRPTRYFKETGTLFQSVGEKFLSFDGDHRGEQKDLASVSLLFHTPNPDAAVAAALLSSYGEESHKNYQQAVAHASTEDLKALFFGLFHRMEIWDALPRAYEMVDFTFEITLSAAAFGQLKRHRMATLLSQGYEVGLGRTVPGSIVRAGLSDDFHRQLDLAQDFYRRIASVAPAVAPYALTNAHRRRVIAKFNARELGHFARLRCDAEAQWDIREVAGEMVKKVQLVMPIAGAFYGGKDSVASMKKKLEGGDWMPNEFPKTLG
jgi:flavin-dependent thymidylate synthase